MGTNLKDIVEAKPISIDSLNGKVLFVDTFNILYQFLSSIRQPDGTPLMTSTGLVSSHLMGLFNRTTKLMSEGIKLVFVFDGEQPREREVQLGTVEGEYVTIEKGLVDGEKIVVEGAQYLTRN